MKIKPVLRKEIVRNLLIYGAFMAMALLGIIYSQTLESESLFLRRWEYQNLLIMCAGIPFLFLQSYAALPDFLEPNISGKARFLVPLTIGVLFGILDVFVIKVMQHPQPYTELPPFLQPFPYSLFLYFSGAFEIEVFYRLIPLTLLLIIGRWVVQGKYFNAFFWTGAVLTSLREPLEQWPDGEVLFILYAFITGFIMNLLQAIHYKKSGFLASLCIRLGHYLFWHIFLGIYVEYVEL